MNFKKIAIGIMSVALLLLALVFFATKEIPKQSIGVFPKQFKG